MDLGGEGSFADAGDIGLGDADDGTDRGGADSGAGDGSASGRRGAGDEGIGSVVDVEEGSLGALEHDLVAVLEGFIEHDGGIGDEGGDLLSGAGVVLVRLFGVEGLGAEQGVSDGVLLVAGVLDVSAEQRGVEQVDDAQTGAVHLVLVGGADAAAGGSDLGAAGGVLGGELDHAVIGQDDLGAIGDEELVIDRETSFFEFFDLVEEGHGVENDAVADDALALRA